MRYAKKLPVQGFKLTLVPSEHQYKSLKRLWGGERSSGNPVSHAFLTDRVNFGKKRGLTDED